jgi:hypothetical protein
MSRVLRVDSSEEASPAARRQAMRGREERRVIFGLL